MAYRVSLAAPAEADTYAAFERIRAAVPRHAEKWLTRFFEAIFSLGKLPARCPVTPEAKDLGYPARHLRTAKGTVFTESFSMSGRTSSTCVSCASGAPPAMPSPPPTWRNKTVSSFLRFP